MSVEMTQKEALAPQDGPADSHTRLRGRALLLARGTWVCVALLAVAAVLASVVVRLQSFESVAATNLPAGWTVETFRDLLGQQGLTVSSYVIYSLVFAYLFTLSFFAVAFILFRRRSDDWFAIYVSLMLITFPLSILSFGNLVQVAPAWQMPIAILSSLGTLLILPFFFLFPDGHVVPAWTKGVIVLWVVTVSLSLFFPGTVVDAGTWPPLANFLMQLAFLCVAVFAQIYRYLRVSDGVARQQTKWLVLGITVTIFVSSIYIFVRVVFPVVLQPTPAGLLYFLALPLVAAAFMFIPFSLGIAILRYRLWDIDLLLNRTLVYFPLTAILAGIFAASITLTQKVFVALTGEKSDAATVITTLIVVALFEPLKRALQALVDKYFKEAPDPAKKLEKFNEQLKTVVEVLTVEQIVPHFLAEVTRAFEAQSAMVSLGSDGTGRRVYTVGEWSGPGKLCAPLIAQSATLGTVELGPRRKGGTYTAKDAETLRENAGLIASAIVLGERWHDRVP